MYVNIIDLLEKNVKLQLLKLAGGITFCMLTRCLIAACEYTWHASESAAFMTCATYLALIVINHVNFHKKIERNFNR